MSTSKMLVRFLRNMYERVTLNSTSFASALGAIEEGNNPIYRIYIHDDYAKLGAYILSAIGAEGDEQLEWVHEACQEAARLVDDPEVEFSNQLTDAIALVAENKDRVDFEKPHKVRGSFVTFDGLANYPTSIVRSDGRYQLISASHKRGTYKKCDVSA